MILQGNDGCDAILNKTSQYNAMQYDTEMLSHITHASPVKEHTNSLQCYSHCQHIK